MSARSRTEVSGGGAGGADIEIPFDADWGREVRAARKRAGMGQLELANAIKSHQATISYIEAGEISASNAVLPLVRKLGKHGLRMPRILFDDAEQCRWVTAGVLLHDVNEAGFTALLAAAENMVAAHGGGGKPD
jgi:transcriptional regulator with XRE-family HTH domain